MPKRQTQEEIVVDFFQNGDLAKVDTVHNIVRPIIKRRLAAVTVKKTAAVKKPTAKSASSGVGTDLA